MKKLPILGCIAAEFRASVVENVWEWVADWYDAEYYGSGAVRDPRGPASGQERVVRGGSWFDSDPGVVRLSGRVGLVPTLRNFSIGLRCGGELR